MLARAHASASPGFPRLGKSRRGKRSGHEAELGGKGASLHRLIAAGLPVPDGFVIPANGPESACRAALGPLLRRVAAEVEGADPPSPAALPARFPELEPAAAELRARLDAALAGWPGKLPAWFVVRSSATVEDGPRASFAGVLESCVGVDRTHLAEAVLLCWAAAYTRAARAYCERNGLDPECIAVAVVVQEMVDARAAGVLLTHDPVSGEPGPLINAVHGLGGPLVHGALQPDSYRRLPDGRWEEQPGRQSWKDALTERGLERVELPEGERGRRVLSAAERAALARLGARVERLMGGPQDIEWAIDRGGALRLLQARPITTLPASARVWTRANMKELFPEVVSPLTASLIERYQHDWLVEYFGRRGFRVAPLAPAMRVIKGRPYLNLTLLEYVAKLAGMGSEEFRANIGGSADAGPSKGLDLVSILRNAAPFARLFGDYLKQPRLGRERLEEARAVSDALLSAPLEGLDDAALLERTCECFRVHLPLAEMGADVAGAIQIWTMLAKALLTGAVASPERFLAAMDVATADSVSARQIQELENLIALAREEQPVRQALLRMNGKLPDLGRLEDTAFAPAWKQFLATYGSRAVYESDSAVPRYAEDPRPLLQAIRSGILAEGSGQERPGGVQRTHKEAQAWLELRWGLPAWERRVPLRMALVRRVLRRLRALYALRQGIRLQLDRFVAAERRHDLVLAGRWAERGWLERPEDFFALRIGEAERALSEPDPAVFLRERVERNRALCREWEREAMPLLLTEGGPAHAAAAEAMPDPEADSLSALAISPGIAEGRVVVLERPEEVTEIEPGSILVAPIAGAAWAPFYSGAEGLIVEMGGVLSHGSILAREYGLPAVANIPGALRLFQTGERVRIDGARGMVWRLDHGGEEAWTAAQAA